MSTNYAEYESGNSADFEEAPELILTPYATFEGEVATTFGTSSEYGQSLGVVWEEIEILDGVLYADPEKHKYKLFSWQESNDLSPAERYERGDDPHAEDARDVITKTYFGEDKTYELVAARVPEVTDESGDVVVEPSSVQRDVEFGDAEGEIEFGDFEDLGGDPVEFERALIWNGAQKDNGANTVSQVTAETLTNYGENAVLDAGDYQNWLIDTSKTNILRDDLDGKRITHFLVKKPGEDYSYNYPVFEDANSGVQIPPDNRPEGGSEAEQAGDSEEAQAAAEADSGSWPEPVADYIESSSRLDLTEERAANLLDDLIDDEDNSLTIEMVEDVGGREALVGQVT